MLKHSHMYKYINTEQKNHDENEPVWSSFTLVRKPKQTQKSPNLFSSFTKFIHHIAITLYFNHSYNLA